MKTYLLIILLLVTILLSSCFQLEDEIISDGTQKLIIDNAFYKNTLTGCTIKFDYYVTEDTCNVSGFAIRWDAHRSGQEDWYIMQKCIPGTRYTIQRTFRQNATVAPIVMMQGYKLNDCETYPKLIARDTLQIRTSIKI